VGSKFSPRDCVHFSAVLIVIVGLRLYATGRRMISFGDIKRVIASGRAFALHQHRWKYGFGIFGRSDRRLVA